MPKSKNERNMAYHRRKRAQSASGSSLMWKADFAAAVAEYNVEFLDVEFGFTCG